MAKDTFYFPHDYNSRNDDKVQALMMDHGATAYGIFWALSEILHEEDCHKIELNEMFYKVFAKQMSTPVKQVMKIVESCIKYELFILIENNIHSLRVEKNIDLRNNISENRSRAGKISAEKRALNKNNSTSVEQVLTGVQQNPTKERKGKERKEKEIKGNKRKEGNKEFTPPEISHVEDYFEENGYSREAGAKAFNYYHSANWHDSQGNQVKNWKQKMQGVWFKPENSHTNPQNNKQPIGRADHTLNTYNSVSEKLKKLYPDEPAAS